MKYIYLSLSLFLFSSQITSQNVGDIIISEMIHNPDAVSDANGEWIEIYNTTSADINIENWKISDDGDNYHVISSSVVVPANDFAILGRNGDFNINGKVDVDYEYSGIALVNSDGEITIVNENDVLIDAVVWDENFPIKAGKSMSLKVDKFDYEANDIADNWEIATSTFGDGDYGTPGRKNDADDEDPLSITNLNKNEYKIFPNPITNEHLTISTSSMSNKYLYIYNNVGQLLLHKESSQSKITFNTTTLKPGVYILKINDKDKVFTRKIIVKD